MNAIQQEIHRVSDALARMNYLKSKNKETSLSALQDVDKKDKEFKKMLRDTKKRMIDANTPMQTISVDELLKMRHIDDI